MAVTTTVGRWGNAMALRIPQALCDEMNLNVGDALEVSVEAGVLVIRRPDERYTLRGRMDSWNGEGAPFPETDWGMPEGREAW